MPTVLLTDPVQRASLASARSLGKAKWAVVTAGSERGLAGCSRYTQKHYHVAPGDELEAEKFREAIAKIVSHARVDVVVPITDRASRALLGFDSAIGARIAGPTRAAYERASNKEELLQIASVNGFDVPRQIVLCSPGDPLEVEDIEAFVVKPTRSVVEVNGESRSLGVMFAETKAELLECIRAFPAEGYPLLIQERVSGDGVGVFLLRSDHRSVCVFGHRRLREKPPAGGVSTYRESISPPATLVARCEKLLDLLGYEGAAMIEFKHDARTGTFALMEINARLWGSVQLAVDAGVDFPLALAQMALGSCAESTKAPIAGVRSTWELGELDHAIALLRKSAVELHLPSDSPVGVVGVLRMCVDRRFGDRLEVFRVSDPLPFGAELLRWITRR